MQATVDLHEAGVVEGADDLGSGLDDAGFFFSEHGEGDVGVFDGEGATEAAALFFLWELDEVEAANVAEKFGGCVAYVQHAERVAGGVIGDGVREGRTDVFYAEVVDEKLGELEDARKQASDFCEESGIVFGFGHHLVVLAHHGDAGSRGDADGFGVAEHLHEAADERHGLAMVTGVVVHLSATGLFEREIDGVAKAFEHTGNGDSCLREQRVVIAGDKKRDAQGNSFVVAVTKPVYK